jgi:putative flavoprotein involved in K+ transport
MSSSTITLQDEGVKLTGKVIGAEGGVVRFADDLVAYTARADVKLARLMRRIDSYIEARGLVPEVGPPEPFIPFFWPAPGPDAIDLRERGIKTVLWATGFRRRYPWLRVPVLDAWGEIRHTGGATPARGSRPRPAARRRNSNFIDGVGADAIRRVRRSRPRRQERHR